MSDNTIVPLRAGRHSIPNEGTNQQLEASSPEGVHHHVQYEMGCQLTHTDRAERERAQQAFAGKVR